MSHISNHDTPWTEIFQAQKKHLTQAQKYVLEYYGTCIYRYLLKICNDQHLANDLAQEFALRFVQGKYKNAHPSAGRFRDYLKALLRNLFYEHCRKTNRRREENCSLTGIREVAGSDIDDTQFDEFWRQTILSRTWQRLEENEQINENHFHTVLKYRAEHPGLRSVEIAEKLSTLLDMELTSDWVRQKLKRGRDKFEDLLLLEIRQTLDDDNVDLLQEELADLKLLAYVK